MIFYFSGTGNSLYAAKYIARHNKENIISIASIMNSEKRNFEYTLKDNEIVGFVFPVYAWAPPKMVLEFIKKMKIGNYKNNYTFAAATCGDNVGNTMKVLGNCLNEKGISLKSGFSIKMPSNYIIMGNVDTKEAEKKKLLAASDTLGRICKVIEEKREGVYEINKGFMPWVLTSVINPLFNKNGISTKKFYANDNCTGCGICESVCNCQTIKVNGKPTWGEECSQCLACIHYCPARAIQYGKGTEKKGRYKNPNINVSEMKIV